MSGDKDVTSWGGRACLGPASLTMPQVPPSLLGRVTLTPARDTQGLPNPSVKIRRLWKHKGLKKFQGTLKVTSQPNQTEETVPAEGGS